MTITFDDLDETTKQLAAFIVRFSGLRKPVGLENFERLDSAAAIVIENPDCFAEVVRFFSEPGERRHLLNLIVIRCQNQSPEKCATVAAALVSPTWRNRDFL